MINENSPTLGACIRMERKRAGLTQSQLGRMVGLSESRVSKIENGAPITPEVASFILGKMGSDIQFKVVGNDIDDDSTSRFLTSAIWNFSRNKKISFARAFRYLKSFKAIDYLTRYKEIEQTLSPDQMVSNMSRVCANNGGTL